MDKKDLFIKEKLQQDKKIPKDIDDMFKNFKGGDIRMENNSKPKFVFTKVLGIAACMVFAVLVGLTIANGNGQIIKVGEKDKASSREEVELQNHEVNENGDESQKIATTNEVGNAFKKLDQGLLQTMGNIADIHKESGKGNEFSDEEILTLLEFLDNDTHYFKFNGDGPVCTIKKSDVQILANQYFGRNINIPSKYINKDGLVEIDTTTGFGVVYFDILSVKHIKNNEYSIEIKYTWGEKDVDEYYIEKVYIFTIDYNNGHIIFKTIEKKSEEGSNEVYSSIIDEYKTAMNDTNYSVETATVKYPHVNKNMMQHYHNEKFKIYYAKYDINKDNYEDLIIYADLGNSNHTIIDVFGIYPYSNGKKDLIKLINEETLGERSKLEIFDNGIMYLHGSGSAFSGVLEFIKMSTNTDHVTEGNKYYYEYDENGNITIYLDEGVKRKTDYSLIDEVVNLYKKGAKVVNSSNLNLVEI